MSRLMAANHLVRRSFDKISICLPWLVITLGTLQKLRSGHLFLSLEHPTIRQNKGIATRREESRDRFHSSNMAEPTFHLRHSHVTAQTLFNSFSTNFTKQVALFCCPFHRTFKENFTIIHDSLDLYRFLNITTMSFNSKTTRNIVYIPG